MLHADFGVAEDCINIYSYGEICVRCGCCSNNPNHIDRMIRQIRYYKERINEEKRFDNWFDDEEGKKYQQKIVASNIRYFKKQIRLTQKLLRNAR